MVEALSDLASTVNAAATVILVIVTTVYVLLTWWLVKETRNARRQELSPVINLDVAPFSVGAMAPKIENIGNGPALDVTGTIRLKPDGEEHQIQSKNIPPGEFTGSTEPQVAQDSHEDFDVMTIRGTYKNVFGEQIPFSAEYDLEILANLDGAESIMNRDPYEWPIRNIESHLRSISENIEMEGFERLINIRTRETILNHLRNDGSLTVSELTQRTGLTHFELGGVLMWMKEAGAVDYNVETNDIIKEENMDVSVRLLEEVDDTQPEE